MNKSEIQKFASLKKSVGERSKMIGKLRLQIFQDKEDAENLKTGIVQDLLSNFVSKMRSSNYEQDCYVDGRFSDDFTKFVSRSGRNWSYSGYTVSREHREAQREYTVAFRNLNGVFLKELLSQSSSELSALARNWSLKNLEGVKD